MNDEQEYIKELQKENEELLAENKKLEEQIWTLKATNDDLVKQINEMDRAIQVGNKDL